MLNQRGFHFDAQYSKGSASGRPGNENKENTNKNKGDRDHRRPGTPLNNALASDLSGNKDGVELNDRQLPGQRRPLFNIRRKHFQRLRHFADFLEAGDVVEGFAFVHQRQVIAAHQNAGGGGVDIDVIATKRARNTADQITALIQAPSATSDKNTPSRSARTQLEERAI